MAINKQKGDRLYINKEWLYDNYWNKRYTLQKMAKLSNCCYVTLWKWMKKYNIKRRNHKESYNPRKPNHFKINDEITEFLNSLLMGDGSLIIPKGSKFAYYCHADKNEEYIFWLSSKLKGFGIKQCGKIFKMKGGYRYKTLLYPEFYNLTRKWYPNGKKRILKDLTITPLILKNWYIGDGNFSTNPLIDSTLFEIEDLKRISKQLNDIGIKHTLREFKDRKRIRISVKSEKEFFDYILSEDSEVSRCYEYKFPKGVISCQ